MRKLLATVLALGAAAVLLSGCVAIKQVTAVQQGTVGKLRVVVVVCKTDNPTVNHPGCDLPANNGEGSTATSQLLLGFRAPAGIGAPQTLSGTTNDEPAREIAFARSASYESELSKLLPPGDGREWVGYLSGPYEYAAGADDSPAREVRVVADLELPRAADGAPFAGPLLVRPVAGARVVGPSIPDSRPVDCGDSPFGTQPTTCVDSPVSAEIGGELSFPTRDFGVVPGRATANPGQTVQMPFDVRGAGALPAGTTASLAAATSLPGATAAPSQASASLADGSSTRVTVPVAIPKAAAPGVYDVSLTGTLPGDEARSGTASLTVRDRQKPVLSRLRVRPKRFAAGFRVPTIAAARGASVAYTLSEDARVRFAVRRCAKRRAGRCVVYKRVKPGFERFSPKGANRFRFTGHLRGSRLRPGAYRLVARATDPSGNRAAPVRTAFSIRR